MNVTYDYYRIFYYVAKYGSLTKAAQILNGSQPNITRAMNNLESQLQITLFVRSKKGVMLTEAGQRLFDRISVAFEQIQIAEREVYEVRNCEVGTVTVGVTDIGLYEVLFPVLNDFRKDFPQISIRIKGGSSISSIRDLKEGYVDFAIVSTPLPEDDFYDYVELMKIQEYAVASKDFLDDGVVIDSFHKMINYPIVMLADNTGTRKFYDELFASNNLELKPQLIASSVNQAISMIKAGLGIGFVPETIVDIDDSFVKLHIKEHMPVRKICLVQEKNRQPSYAANILLSRIREMYKLKLK